MMNKQAKNIRNIKRNVLNILFILSYAYKTDKKTVLMPIIVYTVAGVIYAVYDALFLKILIEFVLNKNIDLDITFGFIFLGMVIYIASQFTEIIVETKSKSKYIKLYSKMQSELLHKAISIDLLSYDRSDFYNDFVLAFQQVEEMIPKTIRSISMLIGDIVSIVTICLIISTINPLFALLPATGFIINLFINIKIMKLEYDLDLQSKKIMRVADYSKRVFYQPEYAKELRLTNAPQLLKKQFDQSIEKLIKVSKKSGYKIALLTYFNQTITFTFLSAFCVPMFISYNAIVKRTLDLGDTTSLTRAESSIRFSLDSLNKTIQEFQRIGLFSERIRNFMDYNSSGDDEIGTASVPDNISTLEIRGLSFRYPESELNTLENINFRIRPGEKIALVGENGSGKSTLIKLILGLYTASEGGVYYNNTLISDYDKKQYRNIVTTVLQDYQIYAATIAENILGNLQNENTSTSKLGRAIKLADFSEKVSIFPEGVYTTLTREFDGNGILLSGGEAQKVAIARMFAKSKEPHIYILDEPSSALDTYTEVKLNENMMEISKNSTTIFISHRLSTTKDVDRIYLLEQGKVIEEGSHDELISNNGKYADMYRKQAYYYQNGNQVESLTVI